MAKQIKDSKKLPTRLEINFPSEPITELELDKNRIANYFNAITVPIYVIDEAKQVHYRGTR